MPRDNDFFARLGARDVFTEVGFSFKKADGCHSDLLVFTSPGKLVDSTRF